MNREEIKAHLDEMERLSAAKDMVAVYREANIWVPAYKCPNCGRYAHAEAGNDSALGYYWMITDCAKCGRYECRGGPMEWRSLEGMGREIVIKQLSEPEENK